MTNTNWQFELGQIVYLRTDPEQLERMVTERKETVGGGTQYGLSHELLLSYHYGVEIDTDFDELKVMQIRAKQEN